VNAASYALTDVFAAGIWTGFAMCLPALGVALITGLAIGLFQALTSIQEMTLTFVPKFAAIFIVLWISAGMIARSILLYFDATILPVIAGI
jgi:flagellar biosynthetic protein FliQ